MPSALSLTSKLRAQRIPNIPRPFLLPGAAVIACFKHHARSTAKAPKQTVGAVSRPDRGPAATANGKLSILASCGRNSGGRAGEIVRPSPL